MQSEEEFDKVDLIYLETLFLKNVEEDIEKYTSKLQKAFENEGLVPYISRVVKAFCLRITAIEGVSYRYNSQSVEDARVAKVQQLLGQ